VGILYRTDGGIFNLRRLQAKSRTHQTAVVEFQFADDYCVCVCVCVCVVSRHVHVIFCLTFLGYIGLLYVI